MAEAVPSASLLPCIDEYPAGWSFDSNDISRGRARFWMNSDRAGPKALEVTLTDSCEASGAEFPSDEPGTRLFVHVDSQVPRYRGERYYLFAGGCITYLFDFPHAGAPVLTSDASTAVGMFRRAVLIELARKFGLKVWSP